MRKSMRIPNMVIVIFLMTSISAVRCLYSSESPIRPDSPKSSLENERERMQTELKRLQQPEVRRERQLLDDLNRALKEYYENKNESNRQKYESLYEQALELPNPSADVYSACATAANLLGRPQQAIALLKKAITEYPEQRVWGPKIPLKVTGYYRIGSIATRIGDSNEAIFAYEAAISNSQDLESITFNKIFCLMLITDITDRLLNDKHLATKRCKEMITEINSTDSSGLGHEESNAYNFFKDWALYKERYLETGKTTPLQKSDSSKQKYIFPYIFAMAYSIVSSCTMPEIEQAAEINIPSIDCILNKFAFVFSYIHQAGYSQRINDNLPKAEKYLLSISETDPYFKPYAETTLEMLHDQTEKIKKRIPMLLERLKNGNMQQRENAASSLSHDPEGIKLLHKAQQDPNKYIRYAAVYNIAKNFKYQSYKPDFDVILEAFMDKDPEIAKNLVLYSHSLQIWKLNPKIL